MALVIKHQLGGNIQYQPFTPSIQNVLDVRYNTQTLVDYLKDIDKRKKYTNDYRGFNEAQTESFNSSLDSYIRGIEDGKIVFSNSGLTKLTNIDGVDPTMEPYIKEYFNSSIRSGLIPMYDEEYKNQYKADLNKILSRSLLGEETDYSLFSPAWLALDPKDEKTLLRGILNRRSAYVKALRAEADRLENDSEYRSRFKFLGWENDLNAYKKVVLALRLHADLIENVNDFDKDESWILHAAAVGLSANDVRKRFFRGEADESGNEILHPDGLVEGNIGFLQTDDPIFYSGNKKYTLGDNYEDLPENAKAAALLLLLAYDRKQIKADWYYWENYVNKYLENLTPHFSNLEVSVYSVSNGPISNKGKQFFIRRREDQYPTKVELIRNADGTYTAYNSNLNINLGLYTESDETRAARTYDAFGDLGLPLSINLAKVLKDAKSINDYFNLLIQDDTRHMNPKMFSNILMYLSAWLWNRPDGKEYTNRHTTPKGMNWYGSTFEIRGEYNKPTAFIWKFRNYGLKFEFTGPNNFIKFGNYRALNPKNIKSVTIDYVHKLKTGGLFKKLQGGGIAEYVEYLKKYGLNRPVDFEPIKTPNKSKEEQKEDDKYNQLVIEGEPTTADKVRFAAATTDLLSSFLVFPKGTNIAALTGTGLSFLGYLTADAIDIVNGKLPAAETLLNDAKLAAVMAMPLFINPTKAKALGAGERMQKLAGMAARYVGTAFALGLIASKELRDDILRSWGKITNPTKMDAHDLTNIAFTLRLVAGGREHVKNIKNSRQLKKALKENQTGQIDYKVKVGDKETTSSIKVKQGDALDKDSIIQRIIDENKALKLEPNQISILNKTEKTSYIEKIKEYTDKKFGKEKEQEKPKDTENKSEGTEESKQETESKETPKSNEIIHVEWKDNRTANPNIEYEEWIPNRAFLYATKENGTIARHNTKLGGWLREMLGPNWDLPYSDYRLVKGYRLGKINQLNKGLFTTLDLFRKLGKELEEIRLSALEGDAKNTALLTKLKKFGYNIIDEEAALAKANEIADLYVSDLSKYDNLQIAQMMYDKDREMGIFGTKRTVENKTKNTAEESVELPQLVKSKSKFNPNDLEYVDEETITPELLQEAYKKFLEEKAVQSTEESPGSIYNLIVNASSKTLEDRQNLISRVFSSFNKTNTKELVITLELLYKKLMELPEVKNNILNGKTINHGELMKLLKLLLDKKEISESNYLKLASSLESTQNILNLINSKILKNTIEPKVELKTEPEVPKVEETPKPEVKEEPKQTLNKKSSIKKNSGHNRLKETQTKRKSRKHMEGGNLNFARTVLSASNGNKIPSYRPGGGILSKGSWYTDFYSLAKDEYLANLERLLENKNGEYDKLFTLDDSDSIWKRNDLYNKLSSIYHDNYINNNDYYEPEDNSVYNYQEWIHKYFPNLIEYNTTRAYSNGRYYKGDLKLTGTYSYVPDNKIASITDDWHTGNNKSFASDLEKYAYYKDMMALQDKYKDRYTFYVNPVNGNVIPLSTSIVPNELELGVKLQTLSDVIGNKLLESGQTSTTNLDKVTLDNKQNNKTEEETITEAEPLSPEWFANLPKDNLTTARLLNTLFGNAMTFAIRDKYKPLFAKDQTYLDFKRVFRDTSATDATNKLYGLFLSRELGASSDLRQNMAATHDLISKYNNAMLAAEEQNRKVFNTTSREAEEAAKTNSLNLTNTYNSNLKKYTDELRLLQEYTAGAMKQAGENVSNLFSALILEKGTERLYARQHYLNFTMQQLQALQNKQFQELLRYYYNKYKTRGGSSAETIDTFYTSKEFKEMSDLYDEFNTKALKILDVHRLNVENLYSALYSSDLFRNPKGYNINPNEYGGNSRPQGVTVKLKKIKLGGKITMAKQGGASVNWVRVENARMINRQVNTSMRETYKSLRLANSELLKTIRAMEPLIRKLNRRESVKLK